MTDSAFVLKNADALRWAIEQKRRRRFRRLVAGPFICNFPTEADSVVRQAHIDCLVFASEWPRRMFQHFAPDLPGSAVWFAGIDVGRWTPGTNRDRALVYDKAKDLGLLEAVTSELHKRSIEFEVIAWGQYRQEAYLEVLRRSAFCVFLSRTETQGLAMFEAWSCDVPTMHWNPGEWIYREHRYSGASSCPYLTPVCGMDFRTPADFAKVLDGFLARRSGFRPREFVLNGYTWDHSIARLLEIVRAP
jgi:hypothetical protein